MIAAVASEQSKDIPSASPRVRRTVYSRCSLCGCQIASTRQRPKNTQCDDCRRVRQREQSRLKASQRERERVLAALRELTSESRNKRDALAIVEELVRLYHGPIGLAARLQELDADLRQRGDLANQTRLFEAVIAILSRVSQSD